MNLTASLRERFDYKWLVFGTIAIGMFVSVLDQTSVNQALPRIASYFGATIPAVQWVLLGYTLTTGSLLLPMGRLSDIVGRKRVYIVGFGFFLVGAALAGISTSLSALILFKVLQGVGAAMIQANGMAIIITAFPASQRGRVIGLFMTTIGMGAIVGPALGGAIVEFLGWRFVFFMGLPLGALSIVTALAILEDNRAPLAPGEHRPKFDWLGAIAFAAAMAVFLVVVTNAHRWDWASIRVIGGFSIAATLLATFIYWERRTAEPMLALELFKRRLFSTGVSASFLIFLSGTSVFFLMPFYLQQVLGFSPGKAGLLIAPTALCFALTGAIAGRLSDRYGWRPWVILGLGISFVSLIAISSLSVDSPLALVIGAMVLQGIGMGLFSSPNSSAVLSTVERSRYGVATAFMNMTRNAANVTGLAIATTIVTAVMGAEGFEPSLDAVASGGGVAVKTAFTLGLRTAFLTMSVFNIIAIGLSLIKIDSAPISDVPLAEETAAEVEPSVPQKT